MLLWGQEALRKIITTLAVKNEEIQSFIYSLKQMLLNVEVRKSLLSPRWGKGSYKGNLPLGTLGLAAHLSSSLASPGSSDPTLSLQGKLGQGAGGPGSRVPVPLLPPGGAEGGHAHEDKAGPCQPHL